MKKFELLLNNEKTKSYQRISVFFIGINLAIFIFLAIQSAENTSRIIGFSGAAILGILLLIASSLFKSKKSAANIVITAAIYTAGITWLLLGKWWPGVFSILLAILYPVSRRPLLVSVNCERVNYTTFPVRTVLWDELNNLVLKDGLLTIDFKNNKIIQAEIADSHKSINEEEFNDFCRQQLVAINKS